jgi:hypothetical protein
LITLMIDVRPPRRTAVIIRKTIAPDLNAISLETARIERACRTYPNNDAVKRRPCSPWLQGEPQLSGTFPLYDVMDRRRAERSRQTL